MNGVMYSVCDPCRQVSFGGAGNKPHESMRLQGALPPNERDGHVDKQYRCIECDTVWLQRTDKWGSDCGFRLTP